jgi:ABC-type transporter Mla MlaB component
MLRITIHEDAKAVTLVLEGKCRGPWVEELEQSWREATALSSGRVLRVDLEQVGFVDERGRKLLAEMCAAGVELNASAGPMVTSIIEAITATCSPAKRA